MITGYRGKNYVELTLELDNTLRFAYQLGVEDEKYYENLQTLDVIRHMGLVQKAIENEECDTSGLFTAIISTLGKGLSKTWLSALNEIPPTIKWSPSLTKIAQFGLADVHAVTSIYSMPKLPQRPQSTGLSSNPTYSQTSQWPKSPRTGTNVTTMSSDYLALS